MFVAGGAKLWPDSWYEKAAEMLRIDLAAAGLPYRDHGGRVFGFHALPVQFGTSLARGGASQKQAQELMWHESIELTSRIYTKRSLTMRAPSTAFPTRSQRPRRSASERRGNSRPGDLLGVPPFASESRSMSQNGRRGETGKPREKSDGEPQIIRTQHAASFKPAEGMGTRTPNRFPGT
jgi:hypothetical protein